MLDVEVVTLSLRLALLLWAAAGCIAIPVLYRLSHDINPIPWAYATVVHAIYTVNMVFILAGPDMVLEGWTRPVFSVLNINLIVAHLWLTWRAVDPPAVRHHA